MILIAHVPASLSEPMTLRTIPVGSDGGIRASSHVVLSGGTTVYFNILATGHNVRAQAMAAQLDTHRDLEPVCGDAWFTCSNLDGIGLGGGQSPLTDLLLETCQRGGSWAVDTASVAVLNTAQRVSDGLWVTTC